MSYLVTGGAGFIGSNIVHRLVDKGQFVRVLDNLATGRSENLDDLRGRIEFMRGDVRDYETARKAASGMKYVLNLAALPSVVRSVEDPLTSNESNVTGTLNMLLAARDCGVERFVFSSSSSVYGDTPTLPKREAMIPAPLSPYAVQKLAGEHYCRIFHSLYGFKTFSLRYFNVFGPRQNPKSQYAAVIPLFIQALRDDRQAVIYGDGGQTRDFTFVENVVDANLACCVAPAEAAGGVFNIACGARISVNELYEMIRQIMGKPIKPRYEESRPGDVRDSQADISSAIATLDWRPKVDFEEGLRRTIDHMMSH